MPHVPDFSSLKRGNFDEVLLQASQRIVASKYPPPDQRTKDEVNQIVDFVNAVSDFAMQLESNGEVYEMVDIENLYVKTAQNFRTDRPYNNAVIAELEKELFPVSDPMTFPSEYHYNLANYEISHSAGAVPLAGDYYSLDSKGLLHQSQDFPAIISRQNDDRKVWMLHDEFHRVCGPSVMSEADYSPMGLWHLSGTSYELS